VNLLGPAFQTSSKAVDDDDAGWFSDPAEDAIAARSVEGPAPAPGTSVAPAPAAPAAPAPTPPPESAPAAPAPPAADALRVSGLAETMPLSDTTTPALEQASEPTGAPEPRTLEGLGRALPGVAPAARAAEPASAATPRAPESSSPELSARDANDHLMSLLGDDDVASGQNQDAEQGDGASPVPGGTPSPPRSGVDVRSGDQRSLPTEPPAPRAGSRPRKSGAQSDPGAADAANWPVLFLKGGLAFAVAFFITSWVLPILSPAPSEEHESKPGAPAAAPEPPSLTSPDPSAEPASGDATRR
jgi:hypothetical protein